MLGWKVEVVLMVGVVRWSGLQSQFRKLVVNTEVALNRTFGTDLRTTCDIEFQTFEHIVSIVPHPAQPHSSFSFKYLLGKNTAVSRRLRETLCRRAAM